MCSVWLLSWKLVERRIPLCDVKPVLPQSQKLAIDVQAPAELPELKAAIPNPKQCQNAVQWSQVWLQRSWTFSIGERWKINHGTRGGRSAQGGHGVIAFLKCRQSEEHSDAHLAIQKCPAWATTVWRKDFIIIVRMVIKSFLRTAQKSFYAPKSLSAKKPALRSG